MDKLEQLGSKTVRYKEFASLEATCRWTTERNLFRHRRKIIEEEGVFAIYVTPFTAQQLDEFEDEDDNG